MLKMANNQHHANPVSRVLNVMCPSSPINSSTRLYTPQKGELK